MWKEYNGSMKLPKQKEERASDIVEKEKRDLESPPNAVSI